MAILPSLSGREVVKIFEADGWRIARQRGSHIILVKDSHIATLSVPDHREDWQVRYATTEQEKLASFRHAKF
jgi:predicted RNA binding protein YcfA (HicA-like mRNA interferase family)